MKTIGRFGVNRIHEGNSLELLKQIPSGSIDHILTDPPFAIDFRAKRNNYNRTAGRVIEGYNEVTKENYLQFSRNWISESHRILKENGSMLVFSGWTNLKDILISLEDAGFTTINHLIWKYQFGVFTKNKFVTSHYHMLFAVKNPKRYRFNKMDHYPEDVLTVNREYWTGKTKTPTKLPTKLVRKLLSYLTNEGDLVLDPFMGSGTTAVVCKSMNRRFLGFEVVPDYVRFANERLAKTQTGLGKWVNASETTDKERFPESIKEISDILKNTPKIWDGKTAIMEMKNSASKNWKQMEWIGFYFESLCEKLLKNSMKIPGPSYGKTRFDGFKKIPWDFKAHAINSNSPIIVNDSEATKKAITQFGRVGIILALGNAEYDKSRSLQKWLEELKGGKSEYERERIKRGAKSRLRKTSFDLKQIKFIIIDDDFLVRCGSFQRGFRNSDGSPRKEKISLDLNTLREELVFSLNFD